MFSKITFLKSGDQAEKNEACLSFLEEIFTKSVHRGGVIFPIEISANIYYTQFTHRETLVALSALFMRNKANEA